MVATYPPYHGGTGNVAREQAIQLTRRGHEVTVITGAYAAPGVEAGPPKVARVRPTFRLGNAPLIPRMASLRGYDLIYLHQPFIFGAELAAAGTLVSRIPIVSSCYNQLIADGLKGGLFDVYSATAARFAMRRSTRINVLSFDHGDSVPVVAAERRRRPNVIDEVPGGVDPERFSPGSAPQVRERHGVPGVALLAMICAGLDPAHHFKRVDLAIESVAALAGCEPPVHLLIVGEGSLRRSLEARAAALGIRHLVHFAGSVSEQELPDHYRASDVLLLASDATESFGLVQVEAMATARPVIVSSLPGVRVVSVDGEHGLHVAPGDGPALTRALRTFAGLGPEVRAAMGARGRERVLAKYTWERSTDALELSLRRAVGG